MSEKRIDNLIARDFVNDDLYVAASAADMTGLTPVPPQNAYEAQSYQNIYPYLLPLPEKEDDDD